MGDIVATKVKEGVGPSSPMLSSTNYIVWAIRIKVLLKVHKVWDVVESESDHGEKTTWPLLCSSSRYQKHLSYK